MHERAGWQPLVKEGHVHTLHERTRGRQPPVY